MNVKYLQPLVDAWNRMTEDLFRPFRLGRWFAVGFMAFLVRCSKGGGGGNINLPGGRGGRFEREMEHVGDTARSFLDNPLFLPIVLSVLVLGLTLWLVFLWLGSRAHFVFLDQVTHRHWRIAEPWERTRTQGNSLFLWRLAFTALVIVAIFVVVIPLVLVLVWAAKRSDMLALVLGVGVGVPLVLAIVIPAAFVDCFLSNFVVPIMYRDGIRTTEGWRRFSPLLKARFWSFVGYGLLIFFLSIGIALALFALGCVTCCVGLLILIIPYIGTVVTLPIHYTWRGFGPSFLAQFGPEHWSWPDAAPAPVAAAPPWPEPPPPATEGTGV